MRAEVIQQRIRHTGKEIDTGTLQTSNELISIYHIRHQLYNFFIYPFTMGFNLHRDCCVWPQNPIKKHDSSSALCTICIRWPKSNFM